jgi:hypothetical protein
VNECLNEVLRVRPLEGRPSRPYIEFGGQVTYRENGSPDRVVVSLREGETSKLGLQASPYCPIIIARSGMVIIIVLLPRRNVAWHDAIVSVMTALLARWWFTNYPVRCSLVVAFVVISCPLGGSVAAVKEQVASPGSSIAFAGRDDSGFDPGVRGRGPQWPSQS